MIPSLEGRVALPFAMSLSALGNQALSPGLAFLCAFIGTILPALPLILISKKIAKKTSGFLHSRFSSKVSAVNLKTSTAKKCFLLASFVAIPLPMTGVWTASLIGGFCDLSIWQAFLSITIGALISCSIILAVCLLFGNSVIYFLIISLIILLIFAIFEIGKYIYKKIKAR